MPWKETQVEDERMRLVTAYLADEFPMSELCEAYGISRKTGYKWVDRYKTCGIEGLQDLSRARHEQDSRTAEGIEGLIIKFRKKHPRWGPKKILPRLVERHPDMRFPAPSTIGEVLKRNGLVQSKRRQARRSATPSSGLTVADSANKVWGGDFKGWFRMGNGERCDPLTMSDLFSRYVIRCTAVSETSFAGVWPVFESAFREYGLPEVIRTDNGPPFASTGLAGLSRLAVCCIRLGIRPERIKPASPQENGCHERMHRTLKAETTRPPAKNRSAQQRVFNRFRREFNYERPHEALGQQPPARLYQTAARPYPPQLPQVEYPGHFEVRQVRTSGHIKWRGQLVYVCQALIGESVGFEPISDRHWRVLFATHQIALFDDFSGKILPYQELKHRPDPEELH